MQDIQRIRDILTEWSENTRLERRDQILAHHAANLLIYDVLPPMKYESAEAYRASWDDWQPETVGDAIFELQDLNITAGNEVAFAHSFIRCGGTTPQGKKFEDLVRATFCLRKIGNDWQVVHQHISKPYGH